MRQKIIYCYKLFLSNASDNKYKMYALLLMSDTEEQFDLTPQIEEPMNTFKIVHLENRSDTYHLTRQVLLDSMLMQNTYCFFYHILTKNIDEFNKMYGSFACLIYRNDDEVDLYLNVDSVALHHIINYIQTTKINIDEIKSEQWHIIDEIIDLATMFGMPNLVAVLRNYNTPEEQFRNIISNNKQLSNLLFDILKMYKKTHRLTEDTSTNNND